MDDGTGLKRVYPPIKSDYAKENYDNIVCIVKHGLNEPILVNNIEYNLPMEPIKQINEFQLTNLLNYMNEAFELGQKFQSIQNTRIQLQNCEK